MAEGTRRIQLEKSVQGGLLRSLSRVLSDAVADEHCRRFSLADRCGGGRCEREGSIEYVVGESSYPMSHATDILLTLADGRMIAIEVKIGATTDSFKMRAYDMLHAKQHHGERLAGILVYAHIPGFGISIKHARNICYMYDRFVARDIRDLREDLEALLADTSVAVCDQVGTARPAKALVDHVELNRSS